MRRLIPLLGVLLIVARAAAAERSPLIDAARNADRDALRTLLQQGASASAADADGTTALHWASYRDDVEAASLLLRAGAKVNAANDLGATPLWIASLNGSAAMVQRLLEAGANPNAALLAGETPVMVAARAGSPIVVEQLLAKGANVNAHAARGQTATQSLHRVLAIRWCGKCDGRQLAWTSSIGHALKACKVARYAARETRGAQVLRHFCKMSASSIALRCHRRREISFTVSATMRLIAPLVISNLHTVGEN